MHGRLVITGRSKRFMVTISNRVTTTSTEGTPRSGTGTRVLRLMDQEVPINLVTVPAISVPDGVLGIEDVSKPTVPAIEVMPMVELDEVRGISLEGTSGGIPEPRVLNGLAVVSRSFLAFNGDGLGVSSDETAIGAGIRVSTYPLVPSKAVIVTMFSV